MELVIQKSDKGNSVVLIDRNVYVDRIKELLSDIRKYNIVNCYKDKENKVKDVLKGLLKNQSISKSYEKYPCGSSLGILYGLAKVHKTSGDGCAPFKTILSVIGTPPFWHP